MKNNIVALNERKEFDRSLYQEDVLIELSERLILEMESAQINQEELERALGKNKAYVTGLLEGFANISLRELADIFSIFNKYVKLMPAYAGQKVCYLESSKFPSIPVKANEYGKQFSLVEKNNEKPQVIKELICFKIIPNMNYDDFEKQSVNHVRNDFSSISLDLSGDSLLLEKKTK